MLLITSKESCRAIILNCQKVTHGAPTVSELLFGILRMISPSSAAELLQATGFRLRLHCEYAACVAEVKCGYCNVGFG